MAAPASVRNGLLDLVNAAWDAHQAGQDYEQSVRIIVGQVNVKVRVSWPADSEQPVVRLVLRPA